MISNLAISTLSSQALLNNNGFFGTQGFFKAKICMKDMVIHLFERRHYPSTLTMVIICIHTSFELEEVKIFSWYILSFLLDESLASYQK